MPDPSDAPALLALLDDLSRGLLALTAAVLFLFALVKIRHLDAMCRLKEKAERQKLSRRRRKAASRRGRPKA